MRMPIPVVAFAVALTLAAAGPASTQGQTSRSAAPAATLVKLMVQRGIDAVAAPDPAEPGRFVAALCFPGTQLLVVSAKYPVPAVLDQRLSNREYRDVYMELQNEITREGRFFVQDMQANGLTARPAKDMPLDIVYENGVKTISLDGDWKAQGLTAADYDARFGSADRRYADLLAALAATLLTSK
jgi:hypothetical protein